MGQAGVRVGADVLYFNPYLREARLAAGYQTNTAVCKASDIGIGSYGRWERLRSYPHNPDVIVRLERVLGKSFESLFPQPIRDAIDVNAGHWKRLSIIREVPMLTFDDPEVARLTYDPQAEFERRVDLPEAMANLIATLHSHRERQVLEYRYGLNGHPEMTLEAVGKVMNINRERVRQIEAKALRKLRHPTRTKLVQEFAPPRKRDPDGDQAAVS